ncbi:MAG: hypothetical protein ACLSV2_04380 [Clostridium sp.]
MDTRLYKLINLIIAIITIILLFIYVNTQIRVQYTKSGKDSTINYEESKSSNEFKLEEFFNKIKEYEDVSLNDIIIYDSWGEVTVKCKGDFTTFKQLIDSINHMEEIKEIKSLLIEGNFCSFTVIFNTRI